jgi:hypothetical protein
MDNQRNPGWIEPLEATALSTDEEAEAQTPVSLEGDMNRTGARVDFLFGIRRRGHGRTIKGGVSYDSPLTSKTEIPHRRLSAITSSACGMETPSV